MTTLTERPRWQRAQCEDIRLVQIHDETYIAESASGNAYLVDVTERSCSCPDHVYRGVSCKHLISAVLEGRYGE